MIVCHVCGKDASLGWIAGFPPAPDSQKMGLCPTHDTEELREKVFALWQEMLTQRIDTKTLHTDVPFLTDLQVTVLYIGGGSMSFLCEQHSVTPQGTLQLQQKGGGSTFIPLHQIKSYTVKPI